MPRNWAGKQPQVPFLDPDVGSPPRRAGAVDQLTPANRQVQHAGSTVHRTEGSARVGEQRLDPGLQLFDAPRAKAPIDHLPMTEHQQRRYRLNTETSFIRPRSRAATSSSAGEIIRHGPHHGAQRSTTTGSDASSTTVEKSSSLASAIQGRS